MKYQDAKTYIKEHISIVDEIGKYVPLKKSGSNFWGVCPFHADKNPSMSVNESLNIFKCFACNEGGDVFHFLEKFLGISYYEAVVKLANELNIEIENDFSTTENYKKQQEIKEKLYNLHRDVANIYYKFLHSDIGKEAYIYLTNKRHLTNATIHKFGLGYAPKDGMLLYNKLKELGYDDELLIHSTLFKVNDSNKIVSFFFDRVIFPVVDVNKHIIGFQSRVLDPNQKNYKYLNSKETEIFKKDSILFAFNYAFNTDKDYYILCEGNMDVITLHQSGFDNAIAAQGTSFNKRQIDLLKRKQKKIYLCQDMDEPGIIAKNKIATMLNNYGFETYVIDLNPSKDVDEFINDVKYGITEFKKRLSNPIPSILYYISTAKMNLNLDDPYDYEKYLSLIVEKLASIENPIVRESYIKKAAIQENIDSNKLIGLVNDYKKGNDVKIKFENRNELNAENELPKVDVGSEKFKTYAPFIYMCFMNPEYRDIIKKAVTIDEIDEDVNKMLYEKYILGVKIDNIYDEFKNQPSNIIDTIKIILNSNYNFDESNKKNVKDTMNILIRNIKILNIKKSDDKSLDNIFNSNIKIKEILDKVYIV